MKKSMSFIAIIIVVCMTSLIFTSCTFKDYATNETDNLFKKASITDLDGNRVKLSKKQSAGDGIILTLPEVTKLNTIVLGEGKRGLKSNVTKFSLSYYNSDIQEWVNFYNQDLIEEYRYCVFDNITTEKIKLEVKSTEEDRKWSLKKFTGHYVEKTYSKDFRVMGYAVQGYGYDKVDPAIFNTVTHINMFQHLFLKPDGTVFFEDKVRDGKTIDGEEFFKKEYTNIVNAIGDRDSKIILTILPDPAAGMDPESLHTPAFQDHSDKIINTINDIFKKYDHVDGIAFDYEYPYSGKANKIFSKFVKQLKTNMPEGKLLALALSSWQFKVGLFPHETLEFVDMVEMMAYDQFDERGYHSTFQFSMVDIVNYLTQLGLKKYLNKINLGLPFYSRPTDGSLYWGDYNLDTKVIGHDNNIVTEPDLSNGRKVEAVVSWVTGETTPVTKPLYYNSPQMIYDKTAYCIDNNLGGMMIWHLGCDTAYNSDNSLLSTMQKAIDSRS